MIPEAALVAALMITPTQEKDDSVRPSTYTGEHYRPKWEPWRKCVVWRESRDNARAANTRSSARGLYQFLDKAWRRSLTYMIMLEHREDRAKVVALRAKPIHKWPRYWQDAAFWTVLNGGTGAKHWNLQGSHCHKVRPQ